MKTFKKHLLVLILGMFLVTSTAYSATVLFPTGGGTGRATLTNSGVLYGRGTAAVGMTAQCSDGQVIKYASGLPACGTDSTGGGIDGSGTTNEITYWVDSDTLGALAVATYPSLTELSYVKGVTSAIQTQLGNKQSLDSGLTSLAGLAYSSTSFVKMTGADTFSLDTNTYLTSNQTITLSGDISGSGTTGITTTIGSDKVLESMLKAVDTASDEDILTYESTTGDFEWHTCAQITGSASLCDGNDAGGTITGSDTHVMFFDGANTPAGDAGMTYDKLSDSLTIVGDFTFGNALTATGDWDALAGGAMTFSALATAGAGAPGKNVEFYAGAGGTGDTAGGQVLLKGGAQSGAGAVGYTAIVDPTSNLKGILSMASLATSDKTFTFPNTSGTIALTSNKLSAFAATSSAELAGVLSDETGTGLTVYGTSPSLTTSVLLNSGFVFNWDSSDLTLTHSANTLTLAGGNLALGANSITMTGSLGATGARLTKGWFTDLEVTNSIVGSITGNSATTTALASDPTDCSANQYAHTIAASGNLTCSSIDISNSTNLAAGRSLTLSGDSVEADVELYTDTKTIWWENPVAGDDFKSIWVNDTGGAITITKLWCESDQTATLMPQVDDGTPADVDSVDLVCISTPDTDTSLDGDATMAAGDRLDIDVASVSGTPTWVSVGFTFTKDD